METARGRPLDTAPDRTTVHAGPTTWITSRPIALAMVWLLLAPLLVIVPQPTADAIEDDLAEGEFRVSNYMTGAFELNNFLWRGYLFTVARDVNVTGLIGGGGPNCEDGFAGAVYQASWDDIDAPGNSDYRVDEMLRQVDFDPVRDIGETEAERQPGDEQTVPFDEPLTLEAGVLYLMAQGRSAGDGGGCHYGTTGLDVENLKAGSPIIDDWWPDGDAALQVGRASAKSCEGGCELGLCRPAGYSAAGLVDLSYA